MSIQATVTANPGVFGDLIFIESIFDLGGADFTVSVVNDTHIIMTIGTSPNPPNPDITNIDWGSIAALFNADPTVAALCSMVGAVADFTVPITNSGPLVGGSAGLGLGQFYEATDTPPPPPCQGSQSMITLLLMRPPLTYAGNATPDSIDPIRSKL